MNELTTTEPPPEPWVNVRMSETPDGTPIEVVPLAKVLTWLMEAKQLHFPPAVRAMHGALAGFAGLRLYVTDSQGRARAVVATDVFGLDAPSPVRRFFSRGVDTPPVAPTVQPLPTGVTPGVSAALYRVLHEPKKPGALISCLAMPSDQAARLWGGVSLAEVARPLSWVDLVAVRKATPGAEWTPAMFEALRSERGKRYKQKGAAKAMAADLGLSEKRVNELLKDGERKRKPADEKPRNVWPLRSGQTG